MTSRITLALHPGYARCYRVPGGDMPGDKFTITPAWHDMLVYDEGDGRSIEFSCPSLVDPPQVTVPARERWTERMPAWAHDRRDVIVARLRAAGAIVYEQGDELTTILSPDGTFRIECFFQPDDRAAPWESTRIVATPGNRVLVHLPLHATSGAIQFPGLGLVVLPLRSRYGQQEQLRVNVAAGTFVLHPSAEEQPLELLSSRLAYTPSQPLRPSHADRVSRRQQIGNVVLAFGGVLLLVGGLWMAFAATNTKDRLIGGVGVVFFGACAVTPILELQRQWPKVAPYVPLAAIVAEIPWIVLLFFGLLFIVGDTPFTATAARENVLLVAAALPAAAGLLWGIVGMVRGRAGRAIELVCLAIGSLGCTVIAGGVVWELLG